MVAGDRVRQVRRQLGRGSDTRVSRRADGLGQARVAVRTLLLELHGFPAGLVRESRTVGHQVAVDDLARHARFAVRGADGVEIGVVEDAQRRIIVAGEDDLDALRVLRGEQVAVAGGRSGRGVERIAAVGDEFLGCVGGLFEIPFPVVFVAVDAVVLAERAFEEAEARLERQRRPFRHAVEIAFGRQIADGEVDVLDHALHDEFARVEGTLQLGVGRTEGLGIPGHVAEALHLLEIEVGAEETGHGVVAVADVGVLAVARVFEQGVELAQVGPRPAAARGGNRAAVAHFGGDFVLHDVVVAFVVKAVAGEDRVEGVAEGLQLVFVREEGLGRHLRQRIFVEPVFARRKRQGAAYGQYR